jgi:FAD/FMN-containing dehydrogenase
MPDEYSSTRADGMTLGDIAAARLHSPGTPGFDGATRLWNGAVKRQPAIVVQPTSPQEVATVVRYARARRLPIAVRGGGHDWAGRSLVDAGVVIDMSRMRSVVVDGAAGLATVAGGATAADVIAAAEPHGLAAATGMVGEVGMVGLTLAGGYGPLNGVAGLALDNLIAADLVLGDGRTVRVSRSNEPDLLWALQGGGGNFGVVTAMDVRLHPISSVTTGVMLFPWQQATEVMRGYAAVVPKMPDELTAQIGVVSGPDGTPVIYVLPTWAGVASAGSGWIDRLQNLGTALDVQIAEMPYSGQLRLLDPFIEWGRHCEMRTRTVATLNQGAVQAIIRAGDTRTSRFSGVVVHHFHGAATRVPVTRTAFGRREPHHVIELLAAWHGTEDGTDHHRWIQTAYQTLEPYALAGGYPNLIGPGQADQAEKSYGPNRDRLVALKRRWDPDNVFSATPLPTTVGLDGLEP